MKNIKRNENASLIYYYYYYLLFIRVYSMLFDEYEIYSLVKML
jgi:hypothetical protein